MRWFILVGLALTSSNWSAGAQSVSDTDVSACDRYAVAGIAFDQIDSDAAKPACERALKKFPTDLHLQFQLARVYTKSGEFERAALLYKKAADRGYAPAQNGLGSLCMEGDGVPRDYALALSLFNASAIQGYAAGQYNLGLMYTKGSGVKRDYVKAAEWYQKAADQGYAQGQFNLGVLYESGAGVAQDRARALVLYRKAAAQGLKDAQSAVADLAHQEAATETGTNAKTSEPATREFDRNRIDAMLDRKAKGGDEYQAIAGLRRDGEPNPATQSPQTHFAAKGRTPKEVADEAADQLRACIASNVPSDKSLLQKIGLAKEKCREHLVEFMHACQTFFLSIGHTGDSCGANAMNLIQSASQMPSHSSAAEKAPGMIYSVFVCPPYAAPQCDILKINGEPVFYQSINECKSVAAGLNTKSPIKWWTCMAKPAPPTWRPAQ